jgi:hypothetical protein
VILVVLFTTQSTITASEAICHFFVYLLQRVSFLEECNVIVNNSTPLTIDLVI